MGELKIASTTVGNLRNVVEDVTVDPVNTFGATGLKETEYTNTDWGQYYAYYRNIPEVKIAIDTRAIWTIGDGFTSPDPKTQVILDHISGSGVDNFDSILENAVIVSRIGGDFFAEIIRADDGTLINLKPLDPGSIKIVVDKNGIIKKYIQMAKVKGGKDEEFKTTEIFRLTNKKVADEIAGVSDIEALQDIIKAHNENFVDMKKVMHRYVKPLMKFSLDTDDTTKIAAYAAKMDSTVALGENIYLPKGTVEQELISVPSNSTLNSSEWRGYLKNYFYQVVGIPQIVLGGSSDFGEATAKIAYLAFEQSVKASQREIVVAVWNQLGLRIDLAFPASLKNEMLSDENKDAQGQMMVQPSDVTAGSGR